ncbi:MAG: glycosyl hydrolase 108 family protein [Rhodomicrobium sp.]
MQVNFERSLANVLESEGGYSNDPHDPGGATMWGIIQSEYNLYRKSKGLQAKSVSLISTDECRAIYKSNYWDAVSGDLLPSGMDYCVFDFAVNSGVHRALSYLHGMDPDLSGPLEIDDYCNGRLAFLQRLHTWRFFGKGWSIRVEKVRKIAKEMMAPQLAVAHTAMQPRSIINELNPLRVSDNGITELEKAKEAPAKDAP